MRAGPCVVIAGVCARAFAESAARAGFACRAVDAFGDLDLKALLPAIGLRRDLGRRYSAAAAAAVAQGMAEDATGGAHAVAYVANFENHPAAVRQLGMGARLFGNPPAVLARARDPRELARVVTEAGERVPITLAPGETDRADPALQWLRKPARGGGGSGVRPWRPGEAGRAGETARAGEASPPGDPIAAGELVQERVAGTLASIVFLADGKDARLLGASWQLAGDAAFGAPGFRYCGSLYPLWWPPGMEERARALAEAVTGAFGLRGINGIDFVLRGEELLVLELNPRFPSSAELMERATGLSMFAAHAAACDGVLPTSPGLPPSGIWGKAVVYARRAVVAGQTRGWLDRDDVRDVPFPGERIGAGSPICTVFARGADAVECRGRLVEAARAVEEELHGQAGAVR